MPNILNREAIEQVQSLYSKGVKSKDSRLSSAYIYSVLIKNRATILKQQINKGQEVSQWSYQQLRAIELEETQRQNSGIVLLRTKYKLPTPILGIGDKTIDSITDIDGGLIFDKTTYKGFKYDSGKKYTSNKPSFYLLEQRAYINYKSKLKGVTAYGLFYNPIEAAIFPSLDSDCEECACKDYSEFEFPLDGDTLNTVVKMTVNELVVMFMQMKEDRNNDAMDNNESGNQMIHQPQEANDQNS